MGFIAFGWLACLAMQAKPCAQPAQPVDCMTLSWSKTAHAFLALFLLGRLFAFRNFFAALPSKNV
jgi:hypothetical protein